DGVERSCAAQTLAEAAQLVLTAITQGDVRAPDQARVATGVVRRVSVTYENQTRGHWAERQAAMIVMRPGYRSLSRSREFRPPLITPRGRAPSTNWPLMKKVGVARTLRP